MREIGDLVLVIAELLQRFDGVKIHIRLCVVVREVGAVLVRPELRARLDLQPVAADVVGLEVDDVAKRLHPLLARLARQAEHEVDRNVVKARAPRERHGLLRLPVGMRAAQRLELRVVVRLHADGDAVEARAAQPREHGQRHGVGVGLKRDLRVAADVEAAVDLGENLRKPAGPEERRRAAAKIDGVDLIARCTLRRLADVQDHGVEIPVHQIPAACAGNGIKVAVFAFAPAERDVDVDAEAFFLVFNDLNERHGKTSYDSSSSLRTAMNASDGTATVPNVRIRFLPSFCFSSSFFLRVISPP